MTDRELLEAAAKAAGIVIVRSRLDDPLSLDMLIENSVRNPHQKAGPWNPLTDDGDALRLAVKLHLELLVEKTTSCAVKRGQAFARVPHGSDSYAATRRAIVRAAAEIGVASEPCYFVEMAEADRLRLQGK